MTVIQMPGSDLEQAGAASTSLISLVRTDEYTREQIRMALPATVSLDTFARATVTALMENDQLATADQKSLFQSIVKCAQDGLLPNNREAALVIYGGKVQYLPMIAGARKIAAEFGWTIKTYAVYENDTFDVDLGTGHVTHRPPRMGEPRGKVVGAWANAFHRDGRESIVEVMDEDAIAKARAVAKTKGVWEKWPAQMYEKTVGHRIAKKLPLDPQDAQRLSRVIDATELGPGEAATTLYGPDGSTFSEIPAGTTPSDELPLAASAVDGGVVADEEPSSVGSISQGDGSASDPGAVVATSPSGGVDEEAAMVSRSFVPPAGVYSLEGEKGPLTLAEIHALGDVTWLRMCATRLSDDKAEWRDAVRVYIAAYVPDEPKAA